MWVYTDVSWPPLWYFFLMYARARASFSPSLVFSVSLQSVYRNVRDDTPNCSFLWNSSSTLVLRLNLALRFGTDGDCGWQTRDGEAMQEQIENWFNFYIDIDGRPETRQFESAHRDFEKAYRTFKCIVDRCPLCRFPKPRVGPWYFGLGTYVSVHCCCHFPYVLVVFHLRGGCVFFPRLINLALCVTRLIVLLWVETN